MAASKAKKPSPMMVQYHAIKKDLPEDILLLFRLGDFYELFLDDAVRASPVLGVALTKRHEMPMCGVPHHAAKGYIGKLVAAGFRVALAEQVGEVTPGKLVKREIAQVITAGTVADLDLLDATQANYLAAVFEEDGQYGLAYLDHTTGEFRVAEFTELGDLTDELGRIAPAETLYSEDQEKTLGEVIAPYLPREGARPVDGYTFIFDQAQHVLTTRMGVQSLDGFGCVGMRAAVSAAGAALAYVGTVLRRPLQHLTRIQPYSVAGHVLVDASSQRNLDLVPTRDGEKSHSLLGAIDQTSTPMGARMLRYWVLHPLRDLAPLLARQDAVAALIATPLALGDARDALSRIRDIERVLGKLAQGSGNPRDLRTLISSLKEVPGLANCLNDLGGDTGRLEELLPNLGGFPELVEKLDTALVDEPPGNLRDGGILRDGYSPELDELRDASTSGKRWIAELQRSESERTGIKSLKVRHNAVFGYFIEITKSNLDAVPDDYHRKQTTANAERFITPELKEVEGKILGADDRALALEQEEFAKLRSEAVAYLEDLQATGAAVAEIDVLCGLSETARMRDYCRPLLNEGLQLTIKDGRHPVLDGDLLDEPFVPNDTFLEPELSRLVLLTGPNMAGKSTYIRQVALITLLAQIGSYVPAAQAEIGLVDRIFTRVGANDDLARGQSTFMVEMTETSLILNSATSRSLVILDEIGRGTATYDGLSIAWAVAEHLHDEIQARTLFATHYHELTQLAAEREAAQNYNVAVKEWNDEIIFLRKIVAGVADRSYGIQVARLAGMPTPVLDRAREVLSHLEEGALPADVPTKQEPLSKIESKKTVDPPILEEPKVKGKAAREEPPVEQLDLFA